MFDLDVTGEGELQAAINQIIGKVQARDRAMPIIGELMIGAVNDVVDMEGPGWEELSPATLAKRRKNGSGAKMLRDTGIMMQSLEKSWSDDVVQVSFGADYGKYHVGRHAKRDAFDLSPVQDGLFADITETLLEGL